jgi:hypothetical protein
MPIIGSILAVAYNHNTKFNNPILLINIGASAPLILKSLASITPAKARVNEIN